MATTVFTTALADLLRIVRTMPRDPDAEDPLAEAEYFALRVAANLMRADGRIRRTEVLEAVGRSDRLAVLLDEALGDGKVVTDREIPAFFAHAITLDLATGSAWANDIISALDDMVHAITDADGDLAAGEVRYYELLLDKWIGNCRDRDLELR
jgi:hypothetical protein